MLVQCDFDGTVTEKDVSFMLLDAFADGNWRQWLKKFAADEITVGRFNTKAFSMVTTGQQTMLDYLQDRVAVRAGFEEFTAFCREHGFRLVIVSNGLEFYIEWVLRNIGLPDIEIHAARTTFNPAGLQVQYLASDGSIIDNGHKEGYTDTFLAAGYNMVYIGDGRSDLSSARRCHHVFATDRLLELCQQSEVNCYPFTDFNDIIRVMQSF